MAATPLNTAAAPLDDANNSASSFDFNIYDDGRGFSSPRMDNAGAIPPPASNPPPLLPGGRCNFVDLAQGLGGAQCGCRRFWSRTAAGQPPAADNSGTGLDLTDPSQSGWCMCSHHACFHDDNLPAPAPSGASLEQPLLTTSSLFPPSAPALDTSTHLPGGAATKETSVTNPVASATPFPEQENKRPRAHNRTPLSPVQDDTSFQVFSAKDRNPCHENDRRMDGFLDSLSFDFPAGLPAGTSAAFPTGFSTSIGPSFADLIAGATDDPGLRAPLDRNPSAAASGLAPASPAPPSVTATSVASSVIVAPADGGSIPDTMSWAPNAAGLSPRDTGRTRPPSVFSTQQAPPSVASSTSQRYLRPFSGRGLHTLKHAAASTTLLKALPPPPEHAVPAEEPGAAGGLSTTRISASSSSIDRGDAHNSLSSAVQAHEARLEKLENPSFSFFPGHEECQDKHDHIDMRVTELESRVDEVEKRLNNNEEASTVTGGGSIVFTRHRLLGSNDDDDATTASAPSTSISSRVSAAADAAATATSLSSADRADIFSQLQSLQTQISLLQSASLPSYNSPWELEVVFLLFPLKGIWIEASQFSTTSAVAAAAAAQRRQAGGVTNSVGCDDDEWTQMPNTLNRQTQDPQPPGAWGAATATDWQATASLSAYSDTPRLLPRAYAPGRVIDNRLKSRGLVQTLSVRGADARSLQLAIASAFGHVFQAVASSDWPRKGKEAAGMASPTTAESQNDHFLGLQHPWVPLRKVHKDSRLRFLTRAEMLTPAMWDASFLTSSVVMKGSGLQRLYITQPDAYFQDRHAYRRGWSWQRLREMGRFPENFSASKLGRGSGGNSSNSGNLGRISPVGGGTDESCWAWDSRLDDPPSLSSPSLSSRYRPSPSPFSRGTTPTKAAHTAPIRRAGNQEPRHTAATVRDRTYPASQLSRVSSSAVSGSAQQFFTIGQSPMAADHPASSPVLRRSMSPFSHSLPAHSRRLVASHPPPLRTVSMPAPPAQGRRPSPMAVFSPVGRRRVQSDGSGRVRPPSSSHHGTRAVHDESRHMMRPSPSPTLLNNDVNHNYNTSGPAVVTGGIHKRHRSTRSPSVNWARNTPRRSMSRGSSVLHAAPTTAWAVEKPARGSTPFCYATPYSNAPAADPPVSSSSSSRRLWHRDNRGQAMQVIDPYDANDYYDDHDMLGYGSEEDLDLDYPMTQDDDEIDVYEDEADDLDDLDTTETMLQADRRVRQNGGGSLAGVRERQAAVLPEDEPWPGIEEDDNNDHGRGYASARSLSQVDSQGQDEDHEGTPSDNENIDPVSFDAEMEEDVAGADGVRPEENPHDESNDTNDDIKHEMGDNEYRDVSPRSDGSSQPSEYPVSRHAWQAPQGKDIVGDGAFPISAWGHAAEGKATRLRDCAFDPVPRFKRGTEARCEGVAVDTDMEFQIHEDGDAAVGGF